MALNIFETLRSAYTRGLVQWTCPCSKSPHVPTTCPYNMSLQHVPTACFYNMSFVRTTHFSQTILSRGPNFVPVTSPTNSNLFELKGQDLSPRLYCSWDKSMRPNKKINQSKTKSGCPCNKFSLKGLFHGTQSCYKSLQLTSPLAWKAAGNLLQGLVPRTSSLVRTNL